MPFAPEDAEIRVTELESILLNCTDDYDGHEIAQMEQELYELNALLEAEKEKPCTFDFTPDRLQILREQPVISASCYCPLDYKISYTFHYDCNHISYMLMWHGMNQFSRTFDPVYASPFTPLSLHGVERIVTDAVIKYVLENMPNTAPAQANAVFSRLRTWPEKSAPLELTATRRYILLNEANCRLLQIQDFIPADSEVGSTIEIAKARYKITGIIPMPFRGTEGVIVRVIPS